MVAIPEEVYHKLLAEKALRHPIDNGISESTTKVAKILRNRKKSPSTKYVEYDQEIKRRVALRQQQQERADAPLEALLDQLVDGLQRAAKISASRNSEKSTSTAPIKESPSNNDNSEKILEEMVEQAKQEALRTKKSLKDEKTAYAVAPPAQKQPTDALRETKVKKEIFDVQYGAGTHGCSLSTKAVIKRRPTTNAMISKFLQRQRSRRSAYLT